uniref:Cyclin A1 n=1 Tax=Anser brachyrhynchus TaxID=132585 RepID=A0A8B9BMS0_9AVES
MLCPPHPPNNAPPGHSTNSPYCPYRASTSLPLPFHTRDGAGGGTQPTPTPHTPRPPSGSSTSAGRSGAGKRGPGRGRAGPGRAGPARAGSPWRPAAAACPARAAAPGVAAAASNWPRPTAAGGRLYRGGGAACPPPALHPPIPPACLPRAGVAAPQPSADAGAMHRTGEKSRAGRREPCPAAPRGGRAVLGVLVENGQQRPGGQSTAVTRHFSVSKNAIPPAGKDELSSCMVSAASKQGFAIYIDEPEQKENYSYQVDEELESSLCELDTSAMTSSIHLLLDLSTGSPMLVDTSFRSQPEQQMGDAITLMTVGEYAEDIHQYLREAEIKYRPKPHYMRKQPDITSGMRAILVDWLVEVGEEYKLRTETLYLAVNYLDRFLSCMSVLRGKLQLVGTAAILLAAKYEEIYPPEVDEFVYITDDTYTKRQLLRMEHLLLKVLAFDLTVPTINQFLLQYIQRHGVCMRTENFARYLAELSLLEADPFLKYLPSQTAAAAYCLANYTVNRSFWPETLAAFTGYSLSEIVPCLTDLHKACLDAPRCQLQAIKEKYKHSKFLPCGVTSDHTKDA